MFTRPIDGATGATGATEETDANAGALHQAVSVTNNADEPQTQTRPNLFLNPHHLLRGMSARLRSGLMMDLSLPELTTEYTFPQLNQMRLSVVITFLQRALQTVKKKAGTEVSRTIEAVVSQYDQHNRAKLTAREGETEPNKVLALLNVVELECSRLDVENWEILEEEETGCMASGGATAAVSTAAELAPMQRIDDDDSDGDSPSADLESELCRLGLNSDLGLRRAVRIEHREDSDSGDETVVLDMDAEEEECAPPLPPPPYEWFEPESEQDPPSYEESMGLSNQHQP